MALENRESGQFITIFNGKLTQRVPDSTPGSVKRVNKQGKTVSEKYYDSFTGKLVDIKVQDGSYGKMWNLSFQDKGDIYILTLNYSNTFATAFLKMLPNVDLSKPMTVSPAQKEVDGKMKSSLFIKQDGVVLKHAYTREKPNGLPDMEQIVIKGQKQWDDSKRIEFLYQMVQKDILPKLDKPVVAVAKGGLDEIREEMAQGSTAPDSDF